jgi:diacylglycerol kinase (ATP)
MVDIRTNNSYEPYSVKRIHIAFNPAAGPARDSLEIIEAVLREHGQVEWEVFETQKDGDARRFAEEAVKAGVDAVVACGGDGTVMEVAQGVQGSKVPMAIFPAGTANVMSVELGISSDLKEAVALVLGDACHTRYIDMGEIDGRSFLLRVGIGLEAELAATPREQKRRYGRLAYFSWAFQKIRELRRVDFTLTMDGKTERVRGVSCMIANSANAGIPRLELVEADVADGQLDVLVIRSMQIPEIARIVGNSLRILLRKGQPAQEPLLHWRAREIKVTTRRRQRVAADGELLERRSEVQARVIPGAVRVIVPYKVDPQAEIEAVEEEQRKQQEAQEAQQRAEAQQDQTASSENRGT